MKPIKKGIEVIEDISSEINSEPDGIKRFVIQTLPLTLGLLSGDPLTMSISGAGILGATFVKFLDARTNWFRRYASNEDVIDLFEELSKQPSYIQYMKEIYDSLVLEVRIFKREMLLRIALNYHRDKSTTFDEKIQFKKIFDRLEVFDLAYLLFFYGRIEPDKEVIQKINLTGVKDRLEKEGLINRVHDQQEKIIENMTKKTSDKLKELDQAVNKLTEDDKFYHPLLGSSSKEIRKYDVDPFNEWNEKSTERTSFGERFVEFVFSSELRDIPLDKVI
jgi:hypothetical protein